MLGFSLNIRVLMVILSICFSGLAHAQTDYIKDIEKGRKAKDKGLRSKRHSPLQSEDMKTFDHLNYFPVDPAWKKEVSFTMIEKGDTIDIMTSSGKVKQFYEYGTLTFAHLGDSDTLTAYKRIWPEGYDVPYAPYLFVPFKDLTTGETSYGGGRYLDIDVPKESGTITLDFNLCYNPYCAYGGGFSCPIPPKKNFVDLKIEAGEKDFGAH